MVASRHGCCVGSSAGIFSSSSVVVPRSVEILYLLVGMVYVNQSSCDMDTTSYGSFIYLVDEVCRNDFATQVCTTSEVVICDMQNVGYEPVSG